MKFKFLTFMLLSLSAYAHAKNGYFVEYKDGLAEYTCPKPTPKDKTLQNFDIGCLSHGVANIHLNDKVGLLDKDGNLITKIKYDEIGLVDGNHTAKVKLNNKYGLINTQTGKELTPIHFDDMHIFEQNRMPVKLNGHAGYIDSTGKMVISPKYGNVYSFNDKYAVVGNHGTASDDTYRMGVVDLAGKEILPPIYREITIVDDKIYVTDENRHDKVMDLDGNILFNLEYPYSSAFYHDYAIVHLLKDMVGYIDITGKEIITPQYIDAKTPMKIGDDVLFIVAKRTGDGIYYGVVDKDNKTRLDFNYKNVVILEYSKTVLVLDKNHKMQLLDTNFKPLTPAIYDDFTYPIGDLIVYQKNHKYGFMNLQGKHVSEAIFDEIKPIITDRYDLASANKTHHGYTVRIGNNWGFYDKDGKELMAVLYDDITHWNDDNLFLKQNGYYGRADLKGNVITPPIYKSYRPLTDGYIKAKMDNEWYLISPTGDNLGKTSKPKYAD